MEFFDRGFWIVATIGFICAILGAIGIAPVDHKEYFAQSSEKTKFSLKNYWDVLKGNKAVRMLVISASTDKLAMQIQGNATVTIMIYGIICGNMAAGGGMMAYTAIPNILFAIFGAAVIATRLGSRKTMLYSSIGGIVTCTAMIILFYVMDPSTFALPGYEGFNGWTVFSLAYLALYLIMKGFASMSGTVTNPMIADVTDYEVVRTGRFLPGLIGSTFSFVDKIVSSLSATIVGLFCAMIGFRETLPQADTPLTGSLKAVGLMCMFGTVLIGYICNIVALHYYPLTKEKMQEVQKYVARIKAEMGCK